MVRCNVMLDFKLAILAMLSRLKGSPMLFHLMFLMNPKVSDYVSPVHFLICQFGDCYSGKADPILYNSCILIETLNLEKNLGIS